MRKSNVLEYEGQEQKVDPLTELLRKGSERLIYRAVEAELQELLSSYSERRTEDLFLPWVIFDGLITDIYSP